MGSIQMNEQRFSILPMSNNFLKQSNVHLFLVQIRCVKKEIDLSSPFRGTGGFLCK